MTEERDTLKACWRCGSEKVTTDCMSRNKDGLCDEPAVCCDNCGIIVAFDIVTANPHKDVISLWNTRATDTLTDSGADVERMRWALERIAGDLSFGHCSVCGEHFGGVLLCGCECSSWEPNDPKQLAIAALRSTPNEQATAE